ncbi:MAG: HupE/UreJ family protein [Pseudomonadota bacterium]
MGALCLPAGRRAAWLWLALALAACASRAGAHPAADYQVRVVHFEQRADGLAAYARLSLTLLLSGAGDGAPASPYVYQRLESGRTFRYLDALAAQADLAGIGRLVADGHRLDADGTAVAPRVVSVRLHPKGFVPPFSTLEQARAATQGAPFPASAPATEARHVLVDAALFYPGAVAGMALRFSGAAAARPADTTPTENMLFYHHGGAVRQHARSGALDAPLALNPGLAGSAWQFLRAGCAHILQGFDHLLFVLCLVIGDLRLKSIALRITGFSIGHSLSLAAGCFGALPDGAWFAAWIEVAIALSLLAAAALAGSRRGPGRLALPATAAVGLVHGCGLAFGLRDMLADSAAPPWTILLFFNLGVEAGQLLVAGTGWLLLRGVQRRRADLLARTQGTLALACAALALLWLTQRLASALPTL